VHQNEERQPMPKPKNVKPDKWPQLEYGGGSWEWDPYRGKPYVLRFRVNGKQATVRGNSTTECIQLRNDRRAEGAKHAELTARLAQGDATVSQMMEAWLDFHAGNKAPQTVDSYRRSIRLVGEQMGERIAHTVTIGDVEDMYLHFVNALDHGQGSLIKIRSHLGMAYEYGMRRGMASVDPTAGSKFPGKTRGAEKPVWLDSAGFGAMRRYLAQNATTANVALLTGLLTGLRPGEVLGLCWDAIDWDAGTIHVKRGLQRSQNSRVYTVVDVLKTETSERVVEMPADLITALRHERAAQGERRLAAREYRDSNEVFTRRDGKTLRFSTLHWHAFKASTALGLPPVSPNQLRHTNASELLDRGVMVADVSKHLGHKDMVMVMTTYGHSMKAQVPTAALLAVEG
jgi:integrase